MTIPGISVLSAMILLAEIGDITRFPTAKQLTSYAGLVPCVHQSGKSRYTGHITKTGRSILRWILVQIAHKAVKSPGNLQSCYIRLKEKKGAKVAIVAIARKLLSLIWVVLTRKVPYRDLREDLLKTKVRRMNRQAQPYPVDKDLNERLLALLQRDADGTVKASPEPIAAG